MSDVSPAGNAAAIVLDTAIASCRAIYVGVGGDISVVVAGQTIVFKNAVAGSIIPLNATKVNSSGTTATNLVALW